MTGGGARAGPRVALVTCEALPALSEDDQLLQRWMGARGWDAEPAIWSDPSIDWGRYDAALIRSTWDYHRRFEEFQSWVDAVDRSTQLLNRAGTVRWNWRKDYLEELARAGIPTIPTERGRPGETLDALAARRGWSDLVVKPLVSAAADATHFVPESERARFEPTYARLVGAADQMVQPFLPGVLDPGERSIVVIDGAVSHAFTKGPALPVDRRAEVGYRSTAPSADEVRLAKSAVAAAPADPLYARVDLVPDPNGGPQLIELELIEPALFFAGRPESIPELGETLGRQLRAR